MPGPDPRPRRRDRRGRGQRGPGVLAPPPAGGGRSVVRTPRERFDRLALDVVAEVDARWSDRLGLVEYAVEDVPHLPDDWEGEVPLASLVPGQGTRPARVVLFRRPVEHRAASRADLEDLLLTVVVEQVAELLGLDPEDVDPRYEP
ncbi:metallopeptidase family protein [Nocardioides perillae]|uniref:Putative Zn-dependent protease with MMP-like domain n=1 Tax=Nocardioides perillae TaxID=1119534 RepID=A0A7Y9US39_9ACTN|nr:putative Zn-dependent protease with MMP-like domain [Nocardioides perillae]